MPSSTETNRRPLSPLTFTSASHSLNAKSVPTDTISPTFANASRGEQAAHVDAAQGTQVRQDRDVVRADVLTVNRDVAGEEIRLVDVLWPDDRPAVDRLSSRRARRRDQRHGQRLTSRLIRHSLAHDRCIFGVVDGVQYAHVQRVLLLGRRDGV